MIKRRRVLQIAGLACAAGPFELILANAKVETDLKLLVVRDDEALPRFAAGDMLLADTSQTRYAGDGIYLYPSWGTPRPYAVRLAATAGDMLEFRNPGNQQLLWTHSLQLDGQFAGKFVEHFSGSQVIGKTRKYRLLQLHSQPVRPAVSGIPGNISGKV